MILHNYRPKLDPDDPKAEKIDQFYPRQNGCRADENLSRNQTEFPFLQPISDQIRVNRLNCRLINRLDQPQDTCRAGRACLSPDFDSKVTLHDQTILPDGPERGQNPKS